MAPISTVLFKMMEAVPENFNKKVNDWVPFIDCKLISNINF